MDSSAYAYTPQNSSHRGVAMVLSLVSAIVLSPLYIDRKAEAFYETKWNTSFVLPVILAGLIIAIKSTSSSFSHRDDGDTVFSSTDTSGVLRIGGSWGLAGVLIMLMVVLSWQDYVQHMFWR